MSLSKIKILTAVVLLSGISLYAADVKVISDKDFFSADTGKINLEIKDGVIKLADSKKEAVLNISFMEKAGKEKLKPGRFNIESNKASDATVSVYTGKPEKILATFTVSRNSEYVLVAPGRDTNGTLVEMKSEISVLPDMLAEDYLYFPDKIKSRCRIPADSYCIMNLMNNGNAISACLWIADDTKAYLGKNSSDSKSIDYNLIDAGKLKKLYVGIITTPGIWHIVKEKLNADKFTKIDWKTPLDAQWLATVKLGKGLLPVNNGNFDTWTIVGENVNPRTGLGIKNRKDWTTWGALHGGFVYPFHIEKENLYAKLPPENWRLSILQIPPAVIYAYKYEKTYRFDNKQIPANQPVLPYDKLSEILPYHEIEHLTAVPPPENAYPATCGVTEAILRYYKDDQVEEKRNAMIKQIDAMNKFVDVKEKRFNEYRSWADGEIKKLNDIAEKKTELKKTAEELIKYLSLIEECYTQKKDKVKTAEDSAVLSARYIELIDDEKLSPEQKEEEVDKLGREIRSMGGSRDTLIAEMRVTVKSIRCHLTEKLTESLTQEEEELVSELRGSCGKILWAKHGHEGK